MLVEQARRRTKALFIGISYSQSQRGTWRKLRGPHKDVRDMMELLNRNNMAFLENKILTDEVGEDGVEDDVEPADKASIIRALHWLVEGASPGDNLFLHFSGHGLQRPTRSPTEPDGFDETIVPSDCPYPPVRKPQCPADCDCDSSNTSCWKPTYLGMVRDNELRNILTRQLPNDCQLVTLFDSCSSGTIMDLEYFYSVSHLESVSDTPPSLSPTPGVVPLPPMDAHANSPRLNIIPLEPMTRDRIYDSPTEMDGQQVRTRKRSLKRGLKKFARWVLPRSSPKQPELAAESGTGPGLVITISACVDGMDVFETMGKHGQGLLTKSFIDHFRPGINYLELIHTLRDRFAQENQLRGTHALPPEKAPYPVLSCSLMIDLHETFQF